MKFTINGVFLFTMLSIGTCPSADQDQTCYRVYPRHSRINESCKGTFFVDKGPANFRGGFYQSQVNISGGNIQIVGSIDQSIDTINAAASVVMTRAHYENGGQDFFEIKHSTVFIFAPNGSVNIDLDLTGQSTVHIVCKTDIHLRKIDGGGGNYDLYAEQGHIIVDDHVGNGTTNVRYHSKFPPNWGYKCDPKPVAY
jgi:hypothetical protein